jgi:hypothetical protein
MVNQTRYCKGEIELLANKIRRTEMVCLIQNPLTDILLDRVVSFMLAINTFMVNIVILTKELFARERIQLNVKIRVNCIVLI